MIRRALLLLGLGLSMGLPTAAQPSVDRFDLVLAGDRLPPAAHAVALKTNPTQGASWTTVDAVACEETAHIQVVPSQSAAQFLGQDLRENYLALRLGATDASDGVLRAAYALPAADRWSDARCARLSRLVRTAPQTVRRHSLAAYERPRPVRLRSDAPVITHIEAPVRHRKPGVMEVEWLNVLIDGTD